MYTECQNKYHWIKEVLLSQKSTKNFAKHKILTLFTLPPTYTLALYWSNAQSTYLEDGRNLRESMNRALYVLRFTKHSETKKTSFEAHFGRAPRTKLPNIKNAISVDSKDLSVYNTRNTAGEITDHLVMSKKKTVEPKFRRG